MENVSKRDKVIDVLEQVGQSVAKNIGPFVGILVNLFFFNDFIQIYRLMDSYTISELSLVALVVLYSVNNLLLWSNRMR